MQFKNTKPQPEPKKNSEPMFSEKTSKRIKRFFIVLGILLVLTVLFSIFYFTSRFFDKYAFEFHAPVSFHAPVVIKEREDKIEEMVEKRIQELQQNQEATESAELEEEEEPTSFRIVPKAYASDDSRTDHAIIDQQEHASILHRVYILESSGGKNDGCKNQGKFNGYGYGQNSSVWNCFDSFEEVTVKVNNWFETKFNDGMSLAVALCYYNQGLKVSDCPYYQKYLSI